MTRSRLYPLLPAWYRGQDAQSAPGADGTGRIQAVVAQAEGSFEALYTAIEREYASWFVETCPPEFLPAIGTLVGLELTGPSLPGDRRLVAQARVRWQRKGSAWALQDALEAATGWPVEIVEFVTALVATQNTRHVRPGRAGVETADHAVGMDIAGGPNLRRIQVRVTRGLWMVVEDADPTPIGNGWYTFDPAGVATWVPEGDPRMRVRVDGHDVSLSAPPKAFARAKAAALVEELPYDEPIVDAAHGRFWLPPSHRPTHPRLGVRVDRVFGRPGAIGAGQPGPAASPPAAGFRAVVSRAFAEDERGPGCFRTLDDALSAWRGRFDAGTAPPDDLDIRVLDSGTYPMFDVGDLQGRTLTLRAHPGEMPCLGGIRACGGLSVQGILVAGDVEATGRRVEVLSCTVRGTTSLPADGEGHAEIAFSVVGPIHVGGATRLWIRDCIVGSDTAGRPGSGTSLSEMAGHGLELVCERTTFLGAVSVGEIVSAVDCVFCGKLTAFRSLPDRVRHCAHPVDSHVGLSGSNERFTPATAPRLLAHSPDAPGYACLVGPSALLEAASDGGEPGAFHFLKLPARRARFDQMLARFLPAGFTASVEVAYEGADG